MNAGMEGSGGGHSSEKWRVIQCSEWIWGCVVYYREYAYGSEMLYSLNGIFNFSYNYFVFVF